MMTELAVRNCGSASSVCNDVHNIQIRLIKIRTFSQSLKICTGILIETSSSKLVPKFSRVQVLCRKTKDNFKEHDILSRINDIQTSGYDISRNNNSGDNNHSNNFNSVISLKLIATQEYKKRIPVQTTSGATVFKCVKVIGYTVTSWIDFLYKTISKSFRHEVFAKFICENFQPKSLKNILDIAGGKCKLSIQMLHRLPNILTSTIIDPSSKIEYITLPEYLKQINLKGINRFDSDADARINKFLTLQKKNLKIYSQCFDDKFDPSNTYNYTAIFGLHPDQATVSALNFSPIIFFCLAYLCPY